MNNIDIEVDTAYVILSDQLKRRQTRTTAKHEEKLKNKLF
jgi:hypothetical protein